jgi:hypothetical protein
MAKLAGFLLLMVALGAQTLDHPVRLRACSLTATGGSIQCEGSATCPEHNVISTFALKTKQVWNMQKQKNCTYGLYRHGTSTPGKTHEFWELCGCE